MNAALSIRSSDKPFDGVDGIQPREGGTDSKWNLFPAEDTQLPYSDALKVAPTTCRFVSCYSADDIVAELPTDLVPSFTQPLSLLTLCSETFTAEAQRQIGKRGFGWSLALGVPLALSSSWAAYSHEVAIQHLAAKAVLHASEFVGPVAKEQREPSVEAQIALGLENLKPGWDGPESLAPSPELIADVKAFFAKVEIKSTGEPDVQVDEDGTVAMFWRAERGRLFSVNFGGAGVVVVSYVSPVASERFAERVVVRDGVALLKALAKGKMAWAVSRRA